MSKRTICCILNYAPHYREEIFLLMDSELNCDFYFGDKTFANIKKVKYTKFKRRIFELKFKNIYHHYYYLKGQINLSFKGYSHYIITGQPYNISSWILLIINKIRGKKTFIWNHGWYGDESKLKKIIKKNQFKLSSGYLLYGDYSKRIMIEEGLAKDKLNVIYNSLAYSKQLLIRDKLTNTSIYSNYFKNDYPVLFFIGRLTSIKKLHLLLEVLKMSIIDQKYFNLVLIGNGIEKENLKRLVIEYNIDKYVWFYGECYDENKIGELIFNASICISPGNIGLTAIHSLSYGTPAITHNNFKKQMPEFEVIKEGVTGSFFNEANPVNLKQTIQKWLLNNPIKTKNIIDACFSIIDKYYNPTIQINLLKEVLK